MLRADELHELRPAVNVNFFINMADMPLNRALGNEQRLSDVGFAMSSAY